MMKRKFSMKKALLLSLPLLLITAGAAHSEKRYTVYGVGCWPDYVLHDVSCAEGENTRQCLRDFCYGIAAQQGETDIPLDRLYLVDPAGDETHATAVGENANATGENADATRSARGSAIFDRWPNHRAIDQESHAQQDVTRTRGRVPPTGSDPDTSSAVELEDNSAMGDVSTTRGLAVRPTGSDPDTASAEDMTDLGSTQGRAPRPTRGAGADRLIGNTGDERDARLGTDRLRSDEAGEARATISQSGGTLAAERSATAGDARAGAAGTPAGCASGSHFPHDVTGITISQTGVGHTGNEELSNRDHIDQDAQRNNRGGASSTGLTPGSDPSVNGGGGTGGGRYTFVPTHGIINNSERDEATANRGPAGDPPALRACDPAPTGPR